MGVGRWQMGDRSPARMEDGRRKMEFAVRSSPARTTKSPFSKAFVRRAKFVAELLATVLISLENSAAQARRFPAQVEAPPARRLWALGFGLWTPARGMRAMFPAPPGRRISGFQIPGGISQIGRASCRE